MKETRVRDSNLELYRIIAMLLIVAHHFVVNSGLDYTDEFIYSAPLSFNSVFLFLFGGWGKTGINCFLLITGYFMCTSQITARKYAKLFCEVLFYNVMIYLIFSLAGYQSFSIRGFILSFLPIQSVDQGFVNCFLLFYLCIPFLNILIRNLDEKKHLLLILLCAFIYILFGTLHRVVFNYVSWFIVLYVIASYLRLYPKKWSTNRRLWGLLSLLILLIACASVVICLIIGERIGSKIAYYFITDSNAFLAVAVAVSSFLFFKNLRIRYSPVINTLAASTFGVLLIHTHGDAMRRWLWQNLLDVIGHYHSAWMPVYAIGCVLAVFLVCFGIDWLRIRFVERPFFRFWDRHIETRIGAIKWK